VDRLNEWREEGGYNMAIWQFDCMVFPEIKKDGNIESEDILVWEKSMLSDDFYRDVETILPLEKSWSKKREQYGKGDGTCIELIDCEHDNEIEFKVRLDLRVLSKEDFEAILSIISKVGGLMLYQGKIYPPNKEEILRLIMGSDMARFCENPTKYLKKLGDRL